MIVAVGEALIDERAARISPFDHGLLVGNGVFETLRVYHGTPFAWTRHHQRLARSGAPLGLEIPPSDVLRERVDRVLVANQLAEGRLRITVTGGPSPIGSARGDAPATVIVAATPIGTWPDSTGVVTVPWPRNERGAVAGLKTISYAENVRALAYATERGAGEALFLNTRGQLCEGTGSNVFLVESRTLRTAPEESGPLPGVTRALVLELAEHVGVPVALDPVYPEAFERAEEVFLTSSTRELQPVDRVDGLRFDVPGRITSRLAAAFADLVERDLDP